MSAPNRQTGKAPRQRHNLPRQLKRVEMKLRIPAYDQLMQFQRDDEPIASIVERLIAQAMPSDQLCV